MGADLYALKFHFVNFSDKVKKKKKAVYLLQCPKFHEVSALIIAKSDIKVLDLFLI